MKGRGFINQGSGLGVPKYLLEACRSSPLQQRRGYDSQQFFLSEELLVQISVLLLCTTCVSVIATLQGWHLIQGVKQGIICGEVSLATQRGVS